MELAADAARLSLLLGEREEDKAEKKFTPLMTEKLENRFRKIMGQNTIL